ETTDSAKSIAAKFDGAIPGLTATARTVFKAEVDLGASTALNFDLTVGDETVSLVGVTSTADLADQINSNASKLGVTANLDTDNVLTITSSTGENVGCGAGTNRTGANAGDGELKVNVQNSDGNYAATASGLAQAGGTVVGYVQVNSPTS